MFTRLVYRRLADLVAVVHALACLFFLVGGLLAFWQPWLALVHMPIALWVCTSYLCGWTCPLTPVEKRLRQAAGDAVYPGGFVDHYTGLLCRLVCGRLPESSTEARLYELGPSPVPAKSPAVRRREMVMGGLFSVWTLVVYAGNYQHLAETFWQARQPAEPAVAELFLSFSVQPGSPAALGDLASTREKLR